MEDKQQQQHLYFLITKLDGVSYRHMTSCSTIRHIIFAGQARLSTKRTNFSYVLLKWNLKAINGVSGLLRIVNQLNIFKDERENWVIPLIWYSISDMLQNTKCGLGFFPRFPLFSSFSKRAPPEMQVTLQLSPVLLRVWPIWPFKLWTSGC